MSAMGHSLHSYGSKETLLQSPTHGIHKVTYRPNYDWDLHVDASRHEPIDLTLTLPHYRARNQPIDHRMNMFVGCDDAPVKIKLCRNFPRSRFYLEIQATTSDITVWLPSDFRGQINHSGKAAFSAGFINRISHNASVNQPPLGEAYEEIEDAVDVITQGRVTFRMWDVQTCAPESAGKEALKRIFSGSSRKQPCLPAPNDWDFLLDD